MVDDIQVRLGETGAPTVRTTEDTNQKHHQHMLLEYLKDGTLQLVTEEGLPVQQVPGDRNQNALSPAAVYNPQSQSAFGHAVQTMPQTQFALQFPYSVDTAPVIQFLLGTGTIVSQDSMAVLSSGVTPDSYSAIVSKDFLVYQPGFGAGCRFTFHGAGDDATTVREAGIGTAEDGFFFSHRNGTMNVVHRRGGRRDIQTLEITGGSTSASTLTITLDNTPVVVSVSDNTGNENETATEIAAAAGFVAAGYLAYAAGNHVTFESIQTDAKAGSFAFDAGTTGTIATLSQEVVGVKEIETVIPQAQWSEDSCDNTGLMPLLDWSKGNVFDIKYQWLGFGGIQFYIENPTTNTFQLVHQLNYLNLNVQPSINNPALQFLGFVTNGAGTTNVSNYLGSVLGYIDAGQPKLQGNRAATSFSKSSVGTSYEPIISFYNPRTFKNRTNRSQVDVLRLSLNASASAFFEVLKNPDLTGSSSWASQGANRLLLQDIGASGYIGGEEEWSETVGGNTVASAADLSIEYIIRLHPGDVVTLVAKADTGTVKVSMAATWNEPI